MKTLSCNIRIGRFTFTSVVNVRINTSVADLTQRAEIGLPRVAQYDGKRVYIGDEPIFRYGDFISIQLGYDGQLSTVFTGYLQSIKAGTTVTITAEDQMHELKKSTILMSVENIKLDDLLQLIARSYEYQTLDLQLGQLRVNNASAAQVLDQLRKDYGLSCYFREGKLYVGWRYWSQLATIKKFTVGFNIISDQLEFKKKEDVKIKVKAISIKPDNTKLEATAGDDDGELRTDHYYNVSATDLKTLATEAVEKYKYDGYKGSFTAFGEPFVRFGDMVQLTDPLFPERDGVYRIKSVNYEFGRGGYRQKIALGVHV